MVRAICGFSTDRVFIGDKGRIMTFTGGAQPPRVVPSPTATGLSSVWGSATDDLWIVVDQETILHGSAF